MDKWWGEPLIVTRPEDSGYCIDFKDEMLDFTAGAEIALLGAHIEFEPDTREFYIKFDSKTYGQCHFMFSAHMIRTVGDLMEYMGLGMATFQYNGQFIPLLKIVSVKKIRDDHLQFSLLDPRDEFRITLRTDYTRDHFLGGDAILTRSNPSHVYDATPMRHSLTSLDIHLTDFIKNRYSMDDLLYSMPIYDGILHGRLHFVPKCRVYRPVTKSVFNKVPIAFRLRCQYHPDNQCNQVRKARLILHLSWSTRP